MLSDEKIKLFLSLEEKGNPEKIIKEAPIKSIEEFLIKNKLSKTGYAKLLVLDESISFNLLKSVASIPENVLCITYQKNPKTGHIVTATAYWKNEKLHSERLLRPKLEELWLKNEINKEIDSLALSTPKQPIATIPYDSEFISKLSELFGCSKSGASGAFKHETDKATKKPPVDKIADPLPQKYTYNWFIKKQSPCLTHEKWLHQLLILTREIIAGEFFRLSMLQEQPKSRFILNTKDRLQNVCVASKEVKGYRSFTSFIEEKIIALQKVNKNITKAEINKTYNILNEVHGLGTLLIIALYLGESDLKFDNFGLDALGNIVKIDNDWCFAEKRLNTAGDKVLLDYQKTFSELSFKITREVLKNPLYPAGYSAWHWGNQIVSGEFKPNETLFFPMTLVHDKKFIKEMNEATLTLVLLPDEFLKVFVDVYYESAQQLIIWYCNRPEVHAKDKDFLIAKCSERLNKDRNEVLQIMQDRKMQIKTLVSEDVAFKNYVHSAEAEHFVKQLEHHLMNFKTAHKQGLSTKYPNLESMIGDEFSNIRSELSNNQCRI